MAAARNRGWCSTHQGPSWPTPCEIEPPPSRGQWAVGGAAAAPAAVAVVVVAAAAAAAAASGPAAAGWAGGLRPPRRLPPHPLPLPHPGWTPTAPPSALFHRATMEALTAEVADTLNAHAFQVGVAIHSLGDITDQSLMARWTTAVVDNLVTEAHKLMDLAPALKDAEFAQGTPVGLLLGEVKGKRPEDIDLRWWAASLGGQSEEIAQYYAVNLPPPGTVYWWQYDFMDPDLNAVPDDNALDVRQALALLMAPQPQPANQAHVSTPTSVQSAASPPPQGTRTTEEHATEEVHGNSPSSEAATSTPAILKSTGPKTGPVPRSPSELGAEAGTTEDNSVVDDHVTVPKPTRPKARRMPKSTADVGGCPEAQPHQGSSCRQVHDRAGY
ncbi:hypothetical protein DENSPDRAFT_848990 [Dentipellis sp. KUC8613]|nr:hypothetical protein DENSPDRAFT_848990 [Dentipellis sp. KUC8613]